MQTKIKKNNLKYLKNCKKKCYIKRISVLYMTKSTMIAQNNLYILYLDWQ